MTVLCQKWIIPGVLHSHLYLDLRLGIELPRALVELSWSCLIPHTSVQRNLLPHTLAANGS